MYFNRIAPAESLKKWIVCYWIVEADTEAPTIEKIIPDGFTELIFHYGDTCRTKISGEWQVQSNTLIAGQLTKYFYLENGSNAKMIAVKLMPAALTQLFGLKMHLLTDEILDADKINNASLNSLKNKLIPFADEAAAKQILDAHFSALIDGVKATPVTKAIETILASNGMISVDEIARAAAVGPRQLERLFKKYIGLTPKYYARIIKFNYIFELIKAGKTSWSEIVYQSGYYDQSHFIKNFKAFTGEDPSAYYFEKENMANFFLNK